MSWEDVKLNDHLRDWDVSEARESAINERAAQLMADNGPKGRGPFSPEVVLLAGEKFDGEDMLKIMLPYLVAGNHAEAGLAVVKLLTDIAEKEAAEVARIQIDREANEPTAAQEAVYDERLRGD